MWKVKKKKKKKIVSENGEMHPVTDPNPTTLAQESHS